MEAKAVAIIPARGGSKRIPRKNIKSFCGKPIIAYSIEAAINSGCFQKVIVSTDDPEIASVAEKYGAEVPQLRDAALSDDYATTLDVMAVEARKLQNIKYICCIYATAPLLLSTDLQQSFKLISEEDDIDYIFSVTNYGFPIQRALKLDNEKRISMFDNEYSQVRSQDLEEAWHDAGQFYWGSRDAWENKCPIFSERSLGYPLPRYRVQDIDYIEDWEITELLFKLWNY